MRETTENKENYRDLLTVLSSIDAGSTFHGLTTTNKPTFSVIAYPLISIVFHVNRLIAANMQLKTQEYEQFFQHW